VLIPDEKALFLRELDSLCTDNGIVLVTGGLGPTSDDMTREIIAESCGISLEFNAAIWNNLKDRFPARKISETNKKQAEIPAGFTIMENPNGTAPGFWGYRGSTFIAALPGPPRELMPMAEHILFSKLQQQFSLEPFQETPCSAFMIGESTLEQYLQESALPGIQWSTRAEEYRILFTLRGGSEEGRIAFCDNIRKKTGPFRIYCDDISPFELLYRNLSASSMTCMVAESCTGGLLSKELTEIPGISSVFWGGAVVYSNHAKELFLGLDPRLLEQYGAVSEEAAIAMTVHGCEKAGTDIAVAITGIAGPGGGTSDKPVGTVWIGGMKKGGKAAAKKFQFAGGRGRIRRRSVVTAVLLADAFLNGKEKEFISNMDVY
jgi:nicotinamide-nucleotide amidase